MKGDGRKSCLVLATCAFVVCQTSAANESLKCVVMVSSLLYFHFLNMDVYIVWLLLPHVA